ncbi:ATP-binding cassette domain-containing protein [Rhodoferax ferrireducens]|uniref:ATP-binding cassette domain-containing protein n=1 Tax=Rhodoferax ferrireducens TaxID=192843 RepID=UPI000E0D0CB3|nr:ATP-binding cassette domain-containing protein [Rhodoferax ferrireducens]
MLSIKHISKRYGHQVALNQLSLDIQSGQFCALLGPNGAGKSTLFQVLTGLFAPDAGDVELFGISLRHQPKKVLARLGVVFQQQALDLDLSVWRNLKFHAQLHGLRWRESQGQAQALLQQLGLEDAWERPIRELSGGNRRKVELARALLHRPSLILMDEPTVGLDPKSRRDLLQAVQTQVREHHCMVLWATHLVEEAEQADRVLVLNHGNLIASGTPLEVTQQWGADTLEQGFIQICQPSRQKENA